MTTGIGRTLRLLVGVWGLSAAGTPTFAQSEPPGWPAIAPVQTLAPTQQEMFPGPPDSPPVTLHFGAAIAASHSTALVGMPAYPGEDDPGTSDQGAVAVFVEGAAGSWA